MQLYYSDILSSRKACAVARYLQSPVEFKYLDLVKGDQQKPDYLALNANGKVPTLIDGAHVVWEADAVMCYLAKKAGSDLWPNDLRQIDIIRWFSWNAQHFYRHAGDAVLREHREAALRHRRTGRGGHCGSAKRIPPIRGGVERAPREPQMAGG